jgi:hypothetical protein
MSAGHGDEGMSVLAGAMGSGCPAPRAGRPGAETLPVALRGRAGLGR